MKNLKKIIFFYYDNWKLFLYRNFMVNTIKTITEKLLKNDNNPCKFSFNRYYN